LRKRYAYNQQSWAPRSTLLTLQIKFANRTNVPFLAHNTGHGAMTTLGRMDHGISISLRQLLGVSRAADGVSATIGDGNSSKVVTDTLWALGKQPVTGTCECVSYLGPLLVWRSPHTQRFTAG
jgi:hypothetical protein